MLAKADEVLSEKGCCTQQRKKFKPRTALLLKFDVVYQPDTSVQPQACSL